MNSAAAAYRPDIDGLRALAVLAVIIFHLSEHALPGGFTGVDVFFVISGYVVASALNERREQALGTFLIGFYARRIARILPALSLMLALTLALYVLLIPILPGGPNRDPIFGVQAFLGWSNIGLAQNATGYFSSTPSLNPWLHTWSLGVEEQYYLLSPLLVYWWLRYQPSAPLKAAAPLVLCMLLSLLACVLLQQRAPAANFFLLFGRFWELAVGAVLFLTSGWRVGTSARAPMSGFLLSMGGLALLGVSFGWNTAEFAPWPAALVPVAGALMLLLAGELAPTTLVARLLAHPLMVTVGKHSYSLYLWHWPVFVGMRWTVGLETPPQQIFAFTLACVLAGASYRWVETPTRRLVWLTRTPSLRAVAASLVLPLAGAAMGMALWNARAVVSLSEVTASTGAWHKSVMPDVLPPGQETFLAWESGLITGWNPACPDGCIPSAFKGRKLFILGDSHAYHLWPLGERLAGEGLPVVMLAKAGCPYLSTRRAMVEDKDQYGCNFLNPRRLKELLTRSRPGDLVLLSSLRVKRYGEVFRLPEPEVTLRDARRWLEPLLAHGLKVVITAPMPLFPEAVYHCLDRWVAGRRSCREGLSRSRDELLARLAPNMAVLRALTLRYPELVLFDPFPLLCPEGDTCGVMRNGIPLFRDTDHLNPYGTHILYPPLRELLVGLVGA